MRTAADWSADPDATADGHGAPDDAVRHPGAGRHPGYGDHRFGPPGRKRRGRGRRVFLVALLIVTIVGATAMVVLVAGGRKDPKGFGEAFSGQPCPFLSDEEVQREFGSAVARDLDSLAGRGFDRSQDRRVVLEDPETCVVTLDRNPVTSSGSPAAIVTMTEGGDAAEIFDRTRLNAENGRFLAQDTVDVGEASFCTSRDNGGVGGVLARAGNRVTYVIFEASDRSATSQSTIPGDAESCREAARVARLVLE